MENKITNEIQLQAACAVWFHNEMFRHRGYFRRVKNELDQWGANRYAQLANNKATGIVAGTWDAFFMTKPITWIEFKWGRNGLSHEQKEFMRVGSELGWQFRVVRDLETFKNISYEFFG